MAVKPSTQANSASGTRSLWGLVWLAAAALWFGLLYWALRRHADSVNWLVFSAAFAPTALLLGAACFYADRAFRLRRQSDRVLADSESRCQEMLTELSASERNLRAMLDAIQESAFLLDEAGIVEAVNQVGAQRLNREPEELIGVNIFDYLPETVAAERRVHLTEALHFQAQVCFVDQRDGRVFETTLYPVLEGDGRPKRAAVYARDITEAQKAAETLRRSEANLERAQETASLGAWSWDVHTNRVEWSKALCRMLEVNPDQLGESLDAFLALVHPEDYQQVRAAIAQALFEEKGFDLEHRLIRPHGGEMHLHSLADVYFDMEGDPAQIIGVIQDITERKEAERNLRIKECAIQSSINAIFLTDMDGRIVYANRAGLEMWEAGDPQSLLGRPLGALFQEAGQADLILDLLASEGEWFGEAAAVAKSGRAFDMQLSANLVDDDQGRPLCLMFSMIDISEQKRAEALLRVQAMYDALTGLFNRRHLMEFLEKEVQAAHRYDYPLSLAMFDLDHFKKINDQYGHHTGDDVLAGLGALVQEEMRAADAAGRYGGEEFVLVTPHTRPPESVNLIERIRERLEKHVFTGPRGESFRVTASFGLSHLRSGLSAEDFLEQADQALYQAKAAGRNRTVIFRD